MPKYKKPSAETGLFDSFYRSEDLKKKPTSLDKLNDRIDWESFRKSLEVHLEYAHSKDGGRPPFDPVFMFKVIVLQKYYGLSEEETEFQILDRFSFQRFLGMSLSDDVPDKNTIWLFKERLGSEGVQALFDEFESLLEDCGLTSTKGKIVDASFVDVPKQRNNHDENAKIKEGEVPEEWEDNTHKLCQKDTDARWMTKNGQRHFGYKNHIKINRKTKLIETYSVTDACTHDSQAMEGLIDEDRDGEMFADSAYSGEPIRQMLSAKKIKSRINEKGYRNNPLTDKQISLNQTKSKIRARVEHVFGFMENNMSANKIRSIGKERANRSIGLGNLIYNFFRFTQLNYTMI